MKNSEHSDCIDVNDFTLQALHTIDERLNRLETPKKENKFETFTKRISFLALAVGIFLSLLSLYDTVFIKPHDVELHNMEELNKTIDSIAELRQDMVKIQFEVSNQQEASYLNSLIVPRVLANIQYATEVSHQLGDKVGVPQLIVLMAEAMNMLDWGSAKKLVSQSDKLILQTTSPLMRSELLRYKARYFFLTEQISQGRTAYQGALKELEGVTTFGVVATRAYITSDWLMYEYFSGDCEIAHKAVGKFIQLVNGPAIVSANRITLIQTLIPQIQAFLTATHRCPAPQELFALGG